MKGMMKCEQRLQGECKDPFHSLFVFTSYPVILWNRQGRTTATYTYFPGSTLTT